MKDQCDWMLNQSIFHQIMSLMGSLEVDLFASRLTRQLPRFYSWRPDPEAEATDAFMQDWSVCRGFANPPWCLIPRCLTKVKMQAARLVLITPLWKTQPWYVIMSGRRPDKRSQRPRNEEKESNGSSNTPATAAVTKTNTTSHLFTSCQSSIHSLMEANG